MMIRLFLIFILIPLQSCSNTLIGEKLENSFDLTEKQIIPEKSSVLKTTNEIKTIELIGKDNKKENENILANIVKDNSLTNKDRFSQKSTKSIKKIIFNPQPYRIIIRLSGANPSAPAETVTEALRKAGIQFEVEKIERFDQENFSENTSLNR